MSPKTRLATPGDSTRQTNAAGFQFDRSAATATDVARDATAYVVDDASICVTCGAIAKSSIDELAKLLRDSRQCVPPFLQ